MIFHSRGNFVGVFVALAVGISSAHAQIQFTDASVAAGVAHQSETYGASWGDLNGDGYPDIYVSNHRTTDSLFLNKGDGTFIDTGSQVLTWVNHEHADSHGGSFGDFDNDGHQDLLVSTGAGNPNQFLVNQHGALIDKTDDYGIGYASVGGRLPLWVDFNGDHLPDFLLAQHTGNTRLFKQVKTATTTKFVEVTNSAKLVCKYVHYGQFFDVDGDGRLDFVCPNETVYPTSIYNTQPFPWQVLFDSTAPNSLIQTVSKPVDSAIGDFDNDGRMDVFVLGGVQLRPSGVQQGGPTYFEAQLTGGNKGFKFISAGLVTFKMDWNQADEGSPISLTQIKIGSSGWSPTTLPFTLDPSNPNVAGIQPPVTTQANLPVMQIGFDPATNRWTLILQTSLTNSTSSVFSEAYLEINSTATITKLQGTGLWATDKAARPTLLMNYAGGFSDATVVAGLSAPVQCASTTTGDYDNDMDLDIYLACRTGAGNIQNILYENQGNGSFVAVLNAGGAGGPVGLAVADGAGTADTVITADYDVDGFLDLFVTNGLNMRPLYYGGPNKLFHNSGNTNHWVEVQLVGTGSEKDAIGARIKATANGVTQLRALDGGYHRWAQEHTPSHFGLAGSTTVDLRVEWPSGTVETFTEVAVDKLYRITEGSGIAVVTPGVAPPYPCGSPNFDGAVDTGVFIWKDCTTASWRIRTTAAGGNITYAGTVTSSSIFTSVTPIGLDSGDSLDSTTNPRQIVYQFATSGTGSDGVNFTPQDGAPTCLKVSVPEGTPVFYGPLRAPVSTSFDIDTLGACAPLPPEVSVVPVAVSESAGQANFVVTLSEVSTQTVTVDFATTDGTATAGVDYTGVSTTVTFAPGETSKTVAAPVIDDALAEGDETFTVTLSNPVNTTLLPFASQVTGTIQDNEISPCGVPTFNAGVTAAAIVWRDCTTGQWYTRVTAGGSSKTITYQGSVTATAAYAAVQAYSVESTDILDFTTNPSVISFTLSIANSNQDGFNFTPAAGAAVCFGLDKPVGATALVGSSMTPVSLPFRLDTLGPCNPTTAVSINSVSGLETAASAAFTVSLSAPSPVTITVDYLSADATAKAAQDYTGVTGRVTFAPGETTKTVLVPILDDTLYEGDETFTLTLISPVNATLGSAVGTGTIADNETAPAASINNISVAENVAGGLANFTLSLSGSSTLPVSVDVATADGTASAPGDYTAVPLTTVSFAPGETSKTVSVPVIDDTQFEGNETFAISLSNATNATLGTVTGTATIVDNEQAPVVSVNNVSVAEDVAGGMANFTVSLSAASPLPTTVSVATANGSAALADYTAVSTTLTFAPGDTSKTIAVPILDDALVEGNETFTLDLSNPVNATLGAAAGTGTIVDNDISVSINNVSVAENVTGGLANFTVSLSSATTQTVTVDIATADGSAVAPADFTAVSLTTLTFTPGQTSKTVSVSVINDTLIEGNESFTLNLSNPTSAISGTMTGTGTIVDNEAAPVLSINNLSVAENVAGGLANFTVNLSAASTQTVSVGIASANATATATQDYSSVSGTLTFAPGVTSQTVAVSILDDALAEGNETFTLTLSSPVNATLSGTAGKATGTIVDNEVSPCGAPTYSAGTTAAVLLWRDCTTGQWSAMAAAGGSTKTITYKGSVSATAAFASVQAVSIESTDVLDFTTNPATISYTLNVTGSNQDGFNLTLPAGATACFGLTSPAGAKVLVGSAMTQITAPFRLDTLKPCSPTTAVSVNSVSASETAANAAFNVSLSVASTATVTVDYATADGTAKTALDYTGVTGRVTFAPGETNKTITMPMLDDSIYEGNETFTLTLSNAINANLGVAIGTGTITDNDSAPVVSINSVSDAENVVGGLANFTVSLSSASAQTVTVDAVSVDGTAVAPGDYTALSTTTLSFVPGETTKTLAVAIVDDALYEGNETFTVNLSNAVNATLGTATGTATITDNETTPVASVDNVSVAENDAGGVANFTVSLSVPSAQTVSVDVASSDVTATSSLDYSAVTSAVTFAPGETSKTLPVPLLDDALVEGNETFTLTLSNPVNVTLGSTEGTATIADDEVPPVVSISDASVSENIGGDAANFTVSLSVASTQTVTVDVATADGSAGAPGDYTAVTLTTLTFAPGETSKAVAVSAVDDTLFEGNETFTVGLSNVTNATLGSTLGTGTIVDDEAAPVISIDDVSVAENVAGGLANFTVSLSAASAVSISVDFATADLSATSTQDYTGVASTVSFAPGETSKTVAVQVLDDALIEGTETFTVTLSNALNATLGTAVGTGTIVDNETPPTVSVDDVSVAENVAGGLANFTVILSGASTHPVTVDVFTADATAVAPGDYAAVSVTTLSFAPGEISKPLAIAITDDVLYEGNETFTVQLSNPTNATLGTAIGTGTVVDNEGAPVASVDNVSVAENVAGGLANFTVSLSAASALSVSVDVASVDVTTTATADYTGVTETVTFAPGETSKTVSVTILDDVLAEGDETFKLALSNPVNATLSPTAAQGTGTILDNELSPCGAPTYNPGVTAGVIVWRDCTTGQWSTRVAAGGSTKTISYKGTVTAPTAFPMVQAVSIESSDILDFTTNAAVISYTLNVTGTNQDGFNFTLPTGATACFAVTAPVGAKVLVGSSMTQVIAPFRLDTLGPC